MPMKSPINPPQLEMKSMKPKRSDLLLTSNWFWANITWIALTGSLKKIWTPILRFKLQEWKLKLPSQIYFSRLFNFILLIIILNDIINLIKDLIAWTKTVAINLLVDRIFIANKIQLRKLWNHGLSISRTIQMLIIFANRCPFRSCRIKND